MADDTESLPPIGGRSANRGAYLARGRGRGGGGGRRRDDDPNVVLSKSLSGVLRHKAKDHGLVMDIDGYVKLDDLLALPKFKNTNFEQIKDIVGTNNKQRFRLMEDPANVGHWLIRANQGHSMETVKVQNEAITAVEQLPIAVHGTYLDKWSSIESNGLSKMKRNHIHMATGLFGEEGVKSGMRAGCNVYIYIDIPKAMADGIPFEKSDNGVVLTEGKNGILTKEYFAKVVEKKTGSILYSNGKADHDSTAESKER